MCSYCQHPLGVFTLGQSQAIWANTDYYCITHENYALQLNGKDQVSSQLNDGVKAPAGGLGTEP